MEQPAAAEVPAGLGLMPTEYAQLQPMLEAHHRYAVRSGQSSSLLAQRIYAPPAGVSTVVRHFDYPQVYKDFIHTCSLSLDPEAGDEIYPRRLHEVGVMFGLPASTSTNRRSTPPPPPPAK